jgi:energy-coupling factor transporter ATP-binding protein EcfA2
MSTFSFTKAVKQQEKLRLALDGPAGSGKTWTALIIATDLAHRDGGRVAVIDSERSSAKKYASDFDFDHLTLPDWSPHTYMGAVRSAVEAGYTVIIIDSFSHAWEGVLELKDNATARSKSKNSYTEGWREATPVHNELVDTVLRADAHVIATLRTKTEYVIEDGKPQKIGMKPIQRDGVDFEFDVVGDMTTENSMVISKTRCSALTGQVIRKPDARLAETLWQWLNDGAPAPVLAPLAERNDLTVRLNALPDATRKTAKQEYARLFGKPIELRLDDLDRAEKLVASFEEPDPPVPPPGSPATTDPTPPGPDGGGAQASRPDDVRVAEDEPQSPPEPTTGSNCRQGEDTPVSSPEAARLSPIDLARLADQAFPITKDDVPPRKLTWTKKRYRYTLTAAVTDGRTVHLDELTADEAIKLAGRFRDLSRARVTWEALEDGLRIGARVLPWVDPDQAKDAA